MHPDLTPDQPAAGEPDRPHVVCAWCGQSRPRSLVEVGRCWICGPDLQTRAWLAAQARTRAKTAIRAARNVLAAPDDEHVWRHRAGWDAAHLFVMGLLLSYCGHAALEEPAQPWTGVPARAALRQCPGCLEAYRRSLEEGL